MILLRVLGATMIGTLVFSQPIFAAPAPVKEVTQVPPRVAYAAFNLKYIETDDLANNLTKYAIIDVRSKFSYDVLHIEGAYDVSFNLPKHEFVAQVKKILAETKKPAVFYCNGTLCIRAHRAAIRLQEAGVPNTLVYDAGIRPFAHKFPTKTVIQGEPMKSASQLISEEAFQARTLNPDKFINLVDADPKAVIIDIRDPWQRAGISLFQMRDVNIPLSESAKLKEAVAHAKQNGRTVYFVDVKGKQIRWLQYLMRSTGMTNYWFAKGGAIALLNAMQE